MENNFSTIGVERKGVRSNIKRRKIKSAKSQDNKNKSEIKLCDINSSRLSRLINGESDSLCDS